MQTTHVMCTLCTRWCFRGKTTLSIFSPNGEVLGIGAVVLEIPKYCERVPKLTHRCAKEKTPLHRMNPRRRRCLRASLSRFENTSPPEGEVFENLLKLCLRNLRNSQAVRIRASLAGAHRLRVHNAPRRLTYHCSEQ